jgi:hypothetical protein
MIVFYFMFAPGQYTQTAHTIRPDIEISRFDISYWIVPGTLED